MVDYILSKVYEQKNQFHDLFEEIDFEEPDIKPDDDTVDEEKIDAEISQSMLNSLIEGMHHTC